MKKVILIIDDVEMERDILRQMFQEDYQIADAEDGLSGIEYIQQHIEQIAIVFLDAHMPKMSGYDVLKYMYEHKLTEQIPVILITGDLDDHILTIAYEAGAIDVIRKPFIVSAIKQRAKNIIELYNHKNHLEEEVQKKTEILKEQYEKLTEHNEQLVYMLNEIIIYRNTESKQHVEYVQGYTKILATHYAKLYPRSRMTQSKINNIVKAAKLHDAGKIMIADSVIKHQGRLSEYEIEYIKQHTIKGGEMVKVLFGLDDDYGRICYNVCRYHHEKYDGTGYPEKLKKDKIPIEAQIVGLADMYDAIVNVTMNKRKYSPREAFYKLLNDECGEISPKLKECLEAARDELEAFTLEGNV